MYMYMYIHMICVRICIYDRFTFKAPRYGIHMCTHSRVMKKEP